MTLGGPPTSYDRERPASRAGGRRGRRLVAVTRRPTCCGRRIAARRHQHDRAACLAGELEVPRARGVASPRAMTPTAEPALAVGATGRCPWVPVRTLHRGFVDPHGEPVRVRDREQIAHTHPSTIVRTDVRTSERSATPRLQADRGATWGRRVRVLGATPNLNTLGALLCSTRVWTSSNPSAAPPKKRPSSVGAALFVSPDPAGFGW